MGFIQQRQIEPRIDRVIARDHAYLTKIIGILETAKKRRIKMEVDQNEMECIFASHPITRSHDTRSVIRITLDHRFA